MSSDVTSPVGRVFAVLDPHRLVQPALEKAEWVAQRNGSVLTLYCCVHDPSADPGSDAQRVLAELTRSWVERLADRPRAQGIEVDVAVESDPNWRKAITQAAAAEDIGLVVKTASPHGSLRRRLTETSDWTLLGDSPHPVLLVNPSLSTNTKVVLAAVKLNPGSQTYADLNKTVVEWAHRISGALEADLHAVTVYRGDEIYFDRQKFADGCRLPRNRVHATEGAAYEGIAEVAAQIGAGVIIVGAARDAPGVGATAQRVIDEVKADVIVLPSEHH